MNNLKKIMLMCCVVFITLQAARSKSSRKRKSVSGRPPVCKLVDGIDIFKKHCGSRSTGPLCEPVKVILDTVDLNAVGQEDMYHMAELFQQDSAVKELAQKIKKDLQEDAVMAENIRRCKEVGDDASFKLFEKNLRAVTKRYAGIDCFFSKEKRDPLMAAAFAAGIECFRD